MDCLAHGFEGVSGLQKIVESAVKYLNTLNRSKLFYLERHLSLQLHRKVEMQLYSKYVFTSELYVYFILSSFVTFYHFYVRSFFAIESSTT